MWVLGHIRSIQMIYNHLNFCHLFLQRAPEFLEGKKKFLDLNTGNMTHLSLTFSYYKNDPLILPRLELSDTDCLMKTHSVVFLGLKLYSESNPSILRNGLLRETSMPCFCLQKSASACLVCRYSGSTYFRWQASDFPRILMTYSFQQVLPVLLQFTLVQPLAMQRCVCLCPGP